MAAVRAATEPAALLADRREVRGGVEPGLLQQASVAGGVEVAIDGGSGP